MSDSTWDNLKVFRDALNKTYASCGNLLPHVVGSEVKEEDINELAECVRSSVENKEQLQKSIDSLNKKSDNSIIGDRQRVEHAQELCATEIRKAYKTANLASKNSQEMVRAVSQMYDCATKEANISRLRKLWVDFADCYQPQKKKSDLEHLEKYNECRDNFLVFQQQWVESSSFISLADDSLRQRISFKEMRDYDLLASLLLGTTSKN
mmetsp:Transcript_15129/g.31431  ORF Transcript_15129/g.31431 Transcript_15129/m.31431 type:complete len:208 (-) Transcript_15129:102-725(-)